MSVHFTVYCPLCEVYGPDIRRSNSVRLEGLWPRRHPHVAEASGGAPTEADALQEWSRFLDEHEWHGPLELRHE